MFLLKLNGKTRDNITFGADLMFNSLYKGPLSGATQNLTLNLGLNLSTSISTNYGNFNLKAGGVSWYRQSRLTIWGNRSFNRISIFERRPQTPLNKIPIDRYSNYYNSGLIDQGIRYGSRAFQGIFLNASKLPLNFSVKGVIGKSNFNRTAFESNDNFTGAFQLKNTLSPNYKICYNYLSSWAQTDSLSDDRRSYSIQTIELDRKWNKIQVQMEIGLGKYSDPENDLAYGEAILLNLKTSKSTKIPLNIQFYRISPQFVNVTGNFLNTSVRGFPNVGGVGTTIRTPFSSPMVGLGFPINNRQGVSVNADISLEKLKINGGIGIFSEIEKSDGSLSYIHNVNSQTLSEFIFLHKIGVHIMHLIQHIEVYMKMLTLVIQLLADLQTSKSFLILVEFQAKYNNKIFGKNYYIFSLTRLNTSQKDFNIVPQIGTQTLISQLSEEIDFSIELNDKAAFVFSYGLEKVLGNSSTDLGDNAEATSTNTFFEKLGLDRFYRYTNSRNQKIHS